MAEINGLTSLKAKLKELRESPIAKGGSAITGFTQNYALYVHEDLEARHPIGQAKYLEQPAMQLVPEFNRIIVEAVRKGTSLIDALLLACLRLQREAQLLVPVDTSALKNSAFSTIE